MNHERKRYLTCQERSNIGCSIKFDGVFDSYNKKYYSTKEYSFEYSLSQKAQYNYIILKNFNINNNIKCYHVEEFKLVISRPLIMRHEIDAIYEKLDDVYVIKHEDLGNIGYDEMTGQPIIEKANPNNDFFNRLNQGQWRGTLEKDNTDYENELYILKSYLKNARIVSQRLTDGSTLIECILPTQIIEDIIDD